MVNCFEYFERYLHEAGDTWLNNKYYQFKFTFFIATPLSSKSLPTLDLNVLKENLKMPFPENA
jgi:hypothetical protein